MSTSVQREAVGISTHTFVLSAPPSLIVPLSSDSLTVAIALPRDLHSPRYGAWPVNLANHSLYVVVLVVTR